MEIIADFHTHTVASTHAYATIKENAKSAKDKGLYAIAITDHGPNMIGAPKSFYFENLSLLPKEMYGVKILKGIEANIINFEDQIALETVKRLQSVVKIMVQR